MLDEMRVNDEQLGASDIRQLENADEIAHFFAKLRYDVDERTNIPDYTVLGMGSESMRQHIQKIELIGKDPEDGDIVIYLFEVRSVTAKLRNDIARRFRERPENALLVLTQDYSELEFVMLERIVSKSQSRRVALKQAIRPIPLTVNRMKPDAVNLRVLKRFTFTEEDSAYQWEKLRSAYMLAEWTEEYFNNRALFSDYYLKKRLTDEKITPEWDEDVRPIGREAFRHLTSARKNYTRQTEDVIRKGLYEPIFKSLGFSYIEQKSSSSAAEEPDYLLYSPDDNEQPIAAALTYVWNRNLDDVDESRELDEDSGGTPFEIPGALVVSLLEAHVAPWVIVTNGKLWRLYSSTASNKATNYYEIDLEEAIAANEQIRALKYWWLFFRKEAFTGFLDDVLKNSADYAKQLGDRLKDRVFVEIFPQFAKGFIADMRQQGVNDIDLDVVFNGTMTFLYRLMFTLYAESLELVPINEIRGYRELSLYRMKGEIKAAGGDVLDESPDKLSKAYKANVYELYGRLSQLFTVVDEGSDELNMPTYNGGLFSQETESGEFLATYGIPDRYLVLGLDRLTRDIDIKTQALAFIDFKSLGVRQLGSIYEGLLEFKLKIATEKLAVTKAKGKEVYAPAKKVKKPLSVIEKGDVYLENDKQERKATGSYYTPDYIVKYIVRHTVGPVLDRKFEALEKQLRDAQKGYRDYVALVDSRRKSTGKDETPAVYWNNPEMQNLVDDCLNVRVLDPAMGSGHFLVEVVDYVSNRLIDFLNGWSENPVWAFIEQTRQDILDDMDRQKVTIDADRLTRVALLKRAVLKRCVYGVDLNEMAVELAKVSLWLDAFTLGAPLSFLDHHLKYGNSLIGARVADVEEALAGQQTLFSKNKFAGVMLATDLMRQVSYLSDNTIEQTRKSAQAYRDARDYLAPYKRVLDVYTSRWFGNTPIAGRRGNKGTDVTIEFLQRDDTQAWLEDPHNPKNRLPKDDYMKAGEVAKIALKSAEEKRFFHWELEFPEVFFAPSTRGGQDVQLDKDGGFDAVVGNPPYGSDFLSSLKSYFDLVYQTSQYKVESFVYFIEKSIAVIAENGKLGYIVPNTWLDTETFSNLRKYILDKSFVNEMTNLGKDVFEGANIDTVILNLSREYRELIRVVDASEHTLKHRRIENPKRIFEVPKSAWSLHKHYRFNVFSDMSELRLFEKVENLSYVVDDIGEVSQGLIPYNTKEQSRLNPYISDVKHNDEWEKLLDSGDSISRYVLNWNGQYIRFGNWLYTANKTKFYESRKILLQRHRNPSLDIRVVATYDDEHFYYKDNLCGIIFQTNYDGNVKYVLAVINSTLINLYYKKNFTEVSLNPTYIKQIPIRRIDFTTPKAKREQLAQQIIGAYDITDNEGVFSRVQNVLAEDKSDVVHDVLAHLAQRMIDLNNVKQTEVVRFLSWLEKRLNILPKDGKSGLDVFAGKTIIQGYLGDYQKGEGELSWNDFLYRLHQNRNRYTAELSNIEGEIQSEFEKSLETLLPIKHDLVRTDALIDKIVYRLYGLTDEEIELIERPQYEQALTDAKSKVVGDTNIDDEEKIEKIAEGILPAAKRFFERVEPKDVDTQLDAELPNWRTLPPDAPIFLQTGDYNLRTQPEHMDFSTSVISYTKAVEVIMTERVFAPFRAKYSDADVNNPFFKRFMRGESHLTLGNYGFIVPSSSEKRLQQFMANVFSDTQPLIDAFKDNEQVKLRNKAAHDEVLTRDEAEQVRGWAFEILGMV